MDCPVETAPALLQVPAKRLEVPRAGDVELEHVRGLGQAGGGALGDPPGTAEAREDDLCALALGLIGDRVGDAVVVENAGDEDALALEDHGWGEISRLSDGSR